MKMEFKSFFATPIKENEVEGLASTYGNIDHVGDVVERGAYSRTISRFNEHGKGLPFLAHHRTDRPIGRIKELKDTSEGLWFKAEFSKSHDGQNVREQFLDGTLDSFSIGYRVLQKQADRINGKSVLRLKEIAVHEISAVTFPCNEMAVLSAVKGDIASSFPNLSLEDQQAVADFAASLAAKTANVDAEVQMAEVQQTIEESTALEEVVEAITSDTLSEDMLNELFEKHYLSYRIKKQIGR